MSHRLTAHARALRKAQTDAERLLWRHLRAHRLRDIKFRRQYPIGTYIVDFLCMQSRLVIELDGRQHLDNIDEQIRDAWLVQNGFRVLPFWNNEVLGNFDGVLTAIEQTLTPARHKTSSSGS